MSRAVYRCETNWAGGVLMLREGGDSFLVLSGEDVDNASLPLGTNIEPGHRYEIVVKEVKEAGDVGSSP